MQQNVEANEVRSKYFQLGWYNQQRHQVLALNWKGEALATIKAEAAAEYKSARGVMAWYRLTLKTEHLAARTFFPVLSVSRTFDLHTHMRVAQDMFVTCCTNAHLKSHPLTTCFIDHSSTCLALVHHFVPHHLLPHRQHCVWLESGDPLRHSARRIAVWPSG